MNKDKFAMLIKKHVIREIMGLSLKEKYLKFINSLFEKAEQEIDKYNFGRLFGQLAMNHQTNQDMRNMVSIHIKDLVDNFPILKTLVPELFIIQGAGSAASDCVYLIGGKKIDGIIPSQFSPGKDNGELKDDTMKKFIKNVLKYKKQQATGPQVTGDKEQMKAVLQTLKSSS